MGARILIPKPRESQISRRPEVRVSFLTVETFLETYGLWAVFFGSALERDATFVLAGVLAHTSRHSFLTILACATLGAWAADLLFFTLGRSGDRAFRKFASYKAIKGKLTKFGKRFGVWAIPMSQLLYGFRTPSMIFWGSHSVPVTRFLWVDLLGCFCLSGVLVSLGYLSSTLMESVLGKVKALGPWFLGFALALAAVGLSVWCIRLLRRWSAGS
jgi:membrane protein DedA with SNARE-associated domain